MQLVENLFFFFFTNNHFHIFKLSLKQKNYHRGIEMEKFKYRSKFLNFNYLYLNHLVAKKIISLRIVNLK